jgi:hypothetical protein
VTPYDVAPFVALADVIVSGPVQSLPIDHVMT